MGLIVQPLPNYFTLVASGNGSGGTFSPADATTYYWGPLGVLPGNITIDLYTGQIPIDCRLVGYSMTNKQNSATPSSETSSVYFRYGSTDLLLSSALVFTTSQVVAHYSAMNLSTDVSAGTAWQIKWITPTWATNPLQVFILVTLYFVPR